MEEADLQFDKSVESLNESIKEQENFLKSGEKQMDEDSLYFMSWAKRLRMLDGRSKAVARYSNEK